MEGWKEYSLSDLAFINPLVSLKKDKSYSFIEMKDLNENYRYVYQSNKKKLNGGARFRNGDTLFARITPCLENGKICQAIGLDNNEGFGSTEFLVFRGKAGVSDSDYVYYLCRTDNVRRFAELHMVGTSGRQRVAKESFENLIIDLPPLPLQQRIAEILGALDDKIELNRQMNHTLEQMAQALYKHSFMDDIDPENLPEEWSVGKLGDVLSLEYGKSLREPERHGGKYPVIGSSGIVGYHSTFLVKAAGVVVGRKGNAGSVLWCSKDFFPIDTTFYVINSLSDKRFHYLFFLLKSLKLKDYNSDSAVPGLNRNQAHDAEIIIPPDKIIETFNSYTVRLFDLIESNTEEINNLSVIRNTLLPKLISGELIPADLHSIEQAV